MKLEKLKPGMVIYDVRKRTGLERFRGSGDYTYWEVFIKKVDLEKREALVSWNGNPAGWVSEKRLSKYRLKKPGAKV